MNVKTMWRATKDQAMHPACSPEPIKSKTALIRRVVVFLTCWLIAAVLWPSWWLVPLALIVGTSLVIHPLCWITGVTHPAGHRHKFAPRR